MAFIYSKDKALPGGSYTITDEDDDSELVISFKRPETADILKINPDISALEAKLIRFQKRLEIYAYADDKEADQSGPTRLSIGLEDLQPLAIWCAGLVCDVEGLQDGDENPVNFEDLDEQDVQNILLSLELDDLLGLIKAAKDSAGLRGN